MNYRISMMALAGLRRCSSTRFGCALVLFVIMGACCGEAQTIAYSPPKFADSDRLAKIQKLLPEVDAIFANLAQKEHLPGLVYGIILDSKMIHTGAVGFANLASKTPAGPDTGFRIASMSKSFVTLAIFNLRDAGKLALDDPVTKYVSEFRKVRPPTTDSPVITIRHLMTMSTGLPEDNPWGDRQMAITKKALRDFVSGGLSFSNPPGQEYEYSNLGFVLLGQVISKASGIPFQKYITDKILRPLGMLQTSWEYTQYGAEKLALGYRWEHGAWRLEPVLHDGEGAACGGIITSLNDFARYVAMHLGAWPARNDPETSPIRRATLREMHQPSMFSGMSAGATLLDGKTPNPGVSFYGYGLGWSIDSRGRIALAHSGGLPGYGSNYRFLPDYGLAVIAFANRTYAPVGREVIKVSQILVERAPLAPREITVSSILETRKGQVAEWIRSWDVKTGGEIAAENFFLDRSREDWMAMAQEMFAKAGKINSVGPIKPRNQLRGTFPMYGENGTVHVQFTLTPESNPKVQELGLRWVPSTAGRANDVSQP
jgi:CubicO group peptidase (beta-lactamase class C family)